jgi:prepilin-type N-terminal cleavage/methylation domain-containing protein
MYKSEQGVTAVELLITMAIVSVVLAGAYNAFLSASKRLVLQNRIVEMQADARAAMDFMVRELRLAYGTPSITTTVTTDDTITFDRLEDTGYSSASSTVNTGNTLRDSTKTWPTGTDGFNTYYTVRIISGTGAVTVADQAPHSISSNTSTQLTISDTWNTIPDTSSRYVITRNRAFTRTSASDNILRYTVGGSVHQSLAELITSLAFSQAPGANTLSITLTAQTRNIDPNTGQRRQYALTETVQRRNCQVCQPPPCVWTVCLP